MEVTSEEISGRHVQVYKTTEKEAPVIYTVDYMENGKSLIEACKSLGLAPFQLVTISGIRWDEDLSPWVSDPVVTREDHFTGEADLFLRSLTEEILPYAEGFIGKSAVRRYLAGYSMAGLFAVYAAYNTDVFSRYSSASGSLWYPGLMEYTEANTLPDSAESFYFSIGDRESAVANKALRTTRDNTERLSKLLSERGVQSVFELNPGNHYRDAALRMAKGIKWTLER